MISKSKIEAIQDRLLWALERDLEQGVQWINDKRYSEFEHNYPTIAAVIGDIINDETYEDMEEDE